MASSIIIIALGLLMMFCRCNAVGGNGGDPSESSISGYGCDYCCSRIDNQTKHVGEIKKAVVDDIPSELQRQAASMAKQSSELKGVKAYVNEIAINMEMQSSELKEVKTSVSDISISLENQSSELKGVKASVSEISVSLENQSSELKGVKAFVSEISVSQEKQSSELKGVKASVSEISVSLENQSSELKGVKASVSEISVSQEKQSSELKGVKASVSEISVSLSKHSTGLLNHDARLKEQGLLLADLNRLVKEIHESLVPRDCSDIRAMGYSTSGVYRVYPGSLAKRIQIDVYCDMTTPGGNWLVFQRRKDGSWNFERTWDEYKSGFGMLIGEFWLGNELLHVLTSNRKYKLRIDLEDFDGQKRYAQYSTFSISSSADGYRLNVDGYSGNAGNSLQHAQHIGMKFSTKDADNDLCGGSCAQQFRGAWWYKCCHASNLNGLYLRGPHKSYADGVNWAHFRGHHYSLKTTEMKISKVN